MRIKKNYASYAQGLTSLASPSLNIDLKKEIVGVESSNFFFLSLSYSKDTSCFSRVPSLPLPLLKIRGD